MSDETPLEHRPSRARVALTIAAVLLLALLGGLVYVFYTLIQPKGMPEATTTDGLTWVRSLYGFGPSADQQLRWPSSVAIAPNGDIYATDPQRARVMVFRPDGTFRRLLHTGAGGTQKGMFIRPESVDIDDRGDVYIADSWANKIIVFDKNGRYSREWPVEIQARGVGVNDRKVYVLDVGKVLVFDDEGKKLASFGSRGNRVGQIDAYQGIAARGRTIYVAEPFNKRLQSFDESGNVVWTVPSVTTAPGGKVTTITAGSESDPNHKWDLPQDLVFDASGRLIVVDAFRFDITVVDPETGKAHVSYGSFGVADGQFYYPTSIDYDAERDWFAVADTRNNRIQIVRIPGSANSNAAAAWRALASPFRYLAIPLALLLLAIILGVWTARGVAKRQALLRSADAAGEGP